MTAPPAWYEQSRTAIVDGDARVAILGCGYVGLTLAVELARSGMRVLGVEPNELRAKELKAGSNPVPDVYIPDGELVALRDAGRLVFETGLEAPHDAYVICVPTPLKDGSPDLRYVESAGEMVAGVLASGATVVLESTTYPGTTEELLRPILEEATGLVAGADFALAHSPERINPGDRDWGLRNTPKVVGGLDAASTDIVCALYSRVCDTVVPVSSPRAAEITKLFENTYREVNIALSNEMAITCHDFDIDPWEVLRAAASKPFGFTAFRPGPGVGGHCLPPGERIYVRDADGESRSVGIEDVWTHAAEQQIPALLDDVEVLAPTGLSIAALDDGEITWNEVTLLGKRYFDGELVQITLDDERVVTVTSDHRMIVEGPLATKRAIELNVGDVLPVWLEADERSLRRTFFPLSGTNVRSARGTAVASVATEPYAGPVYSLETSPSHTFVASHGIVVRNCVPIDPQYLAWRVRGKVGRQFRLLETASDINLRMPAHVALRAAEILNENGKAVRGAKIVLLGMAYKGGSGDMRESPALRVADRLINSGADIVFHDPYIDHVNINGIGFDSQPLDDALLRSADLVMVLTDHPDVDYGHVIDTASTVFDTRGVTEHIDAPAGRLFRA